MVSSPTPRMFSSRKIADAGISKCLNELIHTVRRGRSFVFFVQLAGSFKALRLSHPSVDFEAESTRVAELEFGTERRQASVQQNETFHPTPPIISSLHRLLAT